jgi:hypothetical protein
MMRRVRWLPRLFKTTSFEPGVVSAHAVSHGTGLPA